MKRSQVTIFLIIGIVLIIAVGAMIYLLSTSQNIQSEKDQRITRESVRNYISNCLSNELEEAVEIASIQGGFYSPPDKSLHLTEAIRETPYFFKEEKLIPQKEVLENELNEFVEDLMVMCDLEFYKEKGFEVEEGDIEADSAIINNKVTVELDYPITLRGEETIINVNTYSAEIPSRLYEYYYMAKNVTEIVAENDYVPVSFLVQEGETNDFRSYVYHEKNYSMIISLYDNESIPVRYNFAVKLNESEEEDETPPLNIPPLQASVGYEFVYEFEEHEDLTAYTDLFEIEGGVINFTPAPEEKGEYLIQIASPKDSTYMNLNITSEIEAAPHLQPISDKPLMIDEMFNYQVTATGEGEIFYNAETELEDFEIAEDTGNITFTPSENQEGKYNITIIAVNEFGLTDNETFEVEIYE